MGGIYVIILMVISAFTGIASVFIKSVVGIDDMRAYKKRLRQLERVGKKKKKKGLSDVLESLAVPGEKIFSRWFKKSKLDNIECKLRHAEWHTFLNAKQFLALNYSIEVVAVLLFMADTKRSVLSVLIYGIIFTAPNLLLNNQAKVVQKKIINGFCEFADLVEGYLAGDMILIKAIEKSIPFLDASWQKLITDFVVDCNEKQGILYAIDNLLDKVESPAIKDFFILLKLAVDQGMNSLQCFEEQATLVENLLEEKIMNTIDNKEMLTIAIQFPLLMCNIIVMALYYIVQVLDIFKAF